MNNIQRPSIPFADPHSSWQNNVVNHINQNAIGSGGEFNLMSHGNGFNISLQKSPIPQGLKWIGLYNYSASYVPFDLTYVAPNTQVYDLHANKTITLVNGLYLCIQSIPPLHYNASFFLASSSLFIPSTDFIANQFRWDNYNQYYPQDSASMNIPYGIHSDSGYNIYGGQIYWQYIGGGSGGTIKMSNYGISSSYTAFQDFVYVDPKVDYGIPFAPDTASNADTWNHSNPGLCAGIHLCIKDVPSGSISPISSSNSTRNPFNLYYPTWIQIPSSSYKTVSGSVSGSTPVTANNNYWQAISPRIPMTICLGGNSTTTYWIDAETTSPFDLTLLPYTGSSF